MSAYMVNKKHIDALVWLATRPNAHVHGLDTVPSYTHAGLMTFEEIENEIGRRLIRENRLSINARYPDTVGNIAAEPGAGDVDEASAYRYTPPRRFPTTIEGIKICHGYAYQACEHEGWEDSWAHKLCDAIESDLVRKLPGYDAAPWEWRDEVEACRGPMISLSDLARRKRKP